MTDTIARGMAVRALKSDYLYGYNMAEALRRYRADLGMSDTSIVHILYFGDSIVYGTNTSDVVNKSIPGRLRQLLQTQYGACGEGFIDITDTRWTQAGTWSTAGTGGFGGHMKFSSTAGTQTITLNCTSFDVVYHSWSGGGTVTITVDGVAQTSINCYSAQDTWGNRQTFSGFAAGNHTIVLTAPNPTRGDIEGIIPYTATTGVMVHRVGIPGILSTGWTSPNYSAGWNKLGMSLTIVEVGINDCKTGAGVSTLLTNLTTIVNNINVQSPAPSILFHINNRQGASAGNNWPQYMPVYYQLADQFGAAVIDFSKMWGGSWTLADSYGYYGTAHDDIHPGDKGCYANAQVLAQHLLAI